MNDFPTLFIEIIDFIHRLRSANISPQIAGQNPLV